jgi:hypothetical protein
VWVTGGQQDHPKPEGTIMNTRTKLALSGAVAATLAPLLVLAPAQAATTLGGCTVNPLRPFYSGLDTAAGVSRVDYQIRVLCAGGRSVQVQQYRMEEDQMPRDNDWIDEVTGTTLRTVSFTNGAAVKTVTVRAPLPKTPGDGPKEEVYHKVRFRVTNNSTGTTTAWTPWEESAVRGIYR